MSLSKRPNANYYVVLLYQKEGDIMKKTDTTKKNKDLDVVFLLDRSGSMQGSELDTIQIKVPDKRKDIRKNTRKK